MNNPPGKACWPLNIDAVSVRPLQWLSSRVLIRTLNHILIADRAWTRFKTILTIYDSDDGIITEVLFWKNNQVFFSLKVIKLCGI